MRRGLVLAVLLPVACAAPNPGTAGAPSAPPTASPLPITVKSQGNASSGVTFALQRDGRRIYAVVARANVSKRVGEGSGRSDFEDPHVTFYDRDGTTLFARSPAATVHEEDRTIVMSGGVKARTSSGIRLSCKTLTYDDRTQRIRGEGDVVMTTPRGERLEGQRIDADIRLSQVRVSGKPAAPSGPGPSSTAKAP
jgi:LPS export ABC transporter protein LptC